MAWIENWAGYAIKDGSHRNPGFNSMLIQIVDPACMPPDPAYKQFKERHVFEFLDLEDHDHSMEEEWKITDEQAKKIASLLKRAYASDINVIVHCTMGVCRSGAVVEVAVQMGFEDPGTFRAPNLRVKHKIMKALGWSYDADEKPWNPHGNFGREDGDT